MPEKEKGFLKETLDRLLKILSKVLHIEKVGFLFAEKKEKIVLDKCN